MSAPRPTQIKLHQQSRLLELTFDDGKMFQLPCEYLRVFSPSAEVQGHGQAVLQLGKENINIIKIEPVGSYAVKLHFDDGHNTGLYSWNVLYKLGANQEQNWQDYLHKLEQAGYQRQSE